MTPGAALDMPDELRSVKSQKVTLFLLKAQSHHPNPMQHTSIHTHPNEPQATDSENAILGMLLQLHTVLPCISLRTHKESEEAHKL